MEAEMTSGDSTGAALSLTPAPDLPTLAWLGRDVEAIIASTLLGCRFGRARLPLVSALCPQLQCRQRRRTDARMARDI